MVCLPAAAEVAHSQVVLRMAHTLVLPGMLLGCCVVRPAAGYVEDSQVCLGMKDTSMLPSMVPGW